MTQDDWDRDDNQPIVNQVQMHGNVTISEDFIAASGASWTSAYSSVGTSISSNDHIRLTGDSFNLDLNSLNLGSIQVNINPVGTIAANDTNPRYITPIQYTFNRQSWKYTLAYALNLLFAPWLCIWSKLMNAPVGFRVKNPNYRSIASSWGSTDGPSISSTSSYSPLSSASTLGSNNE
jgi:hypothetical protein